MFIFATSACQNFAKKIVKVTKLRPGRLEIKRFSDGEVYVRVAEDIKKQKVFIMGSNLPPAENLVELLFLINACKESGASFITVLMPYFGYGRADHWVKPGEALSAKVMADLIKAAGANKLITVDLHSPQAKGFIKTPIIHLRAQELLAKAIKIIIRGRTSIRKEVRPREVVIVAPDHGAILLAKGFAKVLRCQIAWMEKIRPRPNVAYAGALHGDVKDKTAVLVDDMIDTAGTIVEAVRRLKEAGAKKIIVAATHPILSGPAVERLKKAPISDIFVTDTIPLPPAKKFSKLHIVPTALLIAKALKRT